MIDTKVIRDVASVTSDTERMQFKPSTVITMIDRLEAAEKDAARYQWLTDDHTDHETRLMASTVGQYIALRGKGATDAAIDTAMKEQK